MSHMFNASKEREGGLHKFHICFRLLLYLGWSGPVCLCVVGRLSLVYVCLYMCLFMSGLCLFIYVFVL
jgi:hypothetical protein